MKRKKAIKEKQKQLYLIDAKLLANILERYCLLVHKLSVQCQIVPPKGFKKGGWVREEDNERFYSKPYVNNEPILSVNVPLNKDINIKANYDKNNRLSNLKITEL